MLQVNIDHYEDGTVSVQSILDTNENHALAIMHEGVINLDVCIPYINQEISVCHNYVYDTDKSYNLKAKLEAVEIDSITQVKCIKYSPLNK